MSEVNGPNLGLNQVKFNGIQKQNMETLPTEVEPDNTPQLSDFSNPKAEALGRSMLIKDVDDTKHDLKALLENPQVADNSDEIFETTYKIAQDAGVENPYEVASSLSTGTV